MNDFLINMDSNNPGIFRVIIIHKKDETRIFIPGIQINPLNSDGSLNEAIYQANKLTYPIALWCSKPMDEVAPEIVIPGWIIYEAGDSKRPVIIGYHGKGLDLADAWSGGAGTSEEGYGSSSGYASNSSLDGRYSSASGTGVINIKGPVEDSRNTKYSDISEIPQIITKEWDISTCLEMIPKYAKMSISQAPTAQAIIDNGGAGSRYVEALGINAACVGNAILLAVTPTFGSAGDYLWIHFTDGSEMLAIIFDLKSMNNIYGPADPANKWGHWVDYENGFGNATSISILEVCGMSPNGINKNCDFIVNLGNFVSDSSLAFETEEQIKTFAHSKFTITSNGAQSTTNTGNTVIDKAITWAIDRCKNKITNQKAKISVSYTSGAGSNSSDSKGYDCSGFVWGAYKYGAGLSLPYASTYSMETTYTSNGFVPVTKLVNFSTGEGLMPGDILVNVAGGHTDLYIGNGQRAGAHSPTTGVYIDSYGWNQSGYNNKYDLVLRYSK